MKTRLILAALLCASSSAWAQLQPSGATKTFLADYIVTHSNTALTLTSNVTSTGGTDVGAVLKITPAFSAGTRTDSLFDITAGGVLRYRFWNSAMLEMDAAANNTQAGLLFNTPSGGSAIFRIAGGSGELADFIANNGNLQKVRIGGVSGGFATFKVEIGPTAGTGTGELVISPTSATFLVPLAFSTTDASGTPGAATVSTPSGQVAVAASAGSVVVTMSGVATTSIVIPVVQTADATCTFIKSAVPTANTLTITMNANCTAATKIGLVRIN